VAWLRAGRSSGLSEAECRRNIEVLWLLRTVKPDFKPIARLPARRSRRIRAGLLLVRAVRDARSLRARVAGRRRNSHNNNYRNLTRRSLAKFICRPAPMKISTRRAGASSSDTSLRSEIDVCRHLVLNLDQSAKVFRVVQLLIRSNLAKSIQ
jgi:hypothetical protein